MAEGRTREVEHETLVHADAGTVYDLIAEVENWPQLFPPTVHVECVERDGTRERIQIWATANGKPKTWTSLRVLDPTAHRIDFRQEVSTPPVASMSGAWVIEEAGEGHSRVRLLHAYQAIGDDPDDLVWIDRAVDRNSHAELAALKESAELATERSELVLSFEDSVVVHGAAKDVYDFLNEADAWPERLGHVASVSLTEDSPGIQVLRMDTKAKGGSTHTTESIRVCTPHHGIVYKQTTLPSLMALHTGRWSLEETSDGRTTATSQHTVVVNTNNIASVLGNGAGITDARRFLRDALGANSRATLEHAKEHAEARR